MTVHGSCLCGDVAWEADGPLEFMHHCHCGRCRKLHGAAFATDVMCERPTSGFMRGREQIARFESSPDACRKLLRRCGVGRPRRRGAVAGHHLHATPGRSTTTPASGRSDTSSSARRRRGSTSATTCRAFEAFPPGVDAAVLPDIVPPRRATRTRRAAAVSAAASRSSSRARRCAPTTATARAAARRAARRSRRTSSSRADGVRIVRGEDLLVSYKVPEARFFTTVFCRRCGSKMPRVSPRARHRHRADGRARRRSGHPPAAPHLRRLEGAVVRHHRRPAAGRRGAAAVMRILRQDTAVRRTAQ